MYVIITKIEMVPKSERFEMRLDPDLLARVDQWSATQPDVPSRAQAMRRLIEMGLQKTSVATAPTNTEKLTLWMLAEVLKGQDTPESDTAKLVQSVIYGGHYWALDWELSGIYHDHVDTRQTLNEVIDALDTWYFIERGFAALSEEDKARVAEQVGPTGNDPKFLGFDGNHEGDRMSIAKFLVEELGRFEGFKGRSMNSHMPTAANYRAMAKAFEPLRTNLHMRDLNAGEIIKLLKHDN